MHAPERLWRLEWERLKGLRLVVLFPGIVLLRGCQDLLPRDIPGLFILRFQRSEILGFVAGLGT